MRVPGVKANRLDYMNGPRALTDYSPRGTPGCGQAMQRSRGVRITRGVIVNGIVCGLLVGFIALVGVQLLAGQASGAGRQTGQAEARQASGAVRQGGQAEAREASEGWPTYNRDLAGTRYSRLTQINTNNVSTLAQAWSYRLRPEPGRSVPAIDKPASSFELFQQVTPIVVNGVMYLPSGNRVVALEPETGKEIWRYELPEGLASFRGVAYWPGDPSTTLGAGGVPARIFFTSLRKLIALRADTGVLARDFADGGVLDLEIPYAGVPVLYRNIILMGSNFFGPGERHIGPHLTTSRGEKGDVHAYDART